MKTIEIQLYEFSELSPEAQQNAINIWRNNEDYSDLDGFVLNAKEFIGANGFGGNIDLFYSLSNSQGDGLSFNSEYFDKINDIFIGILGEGKQKTIDIIINTCTFTNKVSNNRYCYASREDIRFEFDDSRGNKNNIMHIVSLVETKIKDIYIDLCEQLEKQGYDAIDLIESDSYISETLIINEYDFTSDGKMYKN